MTELVDNAAAVADIERTRDALRDEARSRLGVAGDHNTASVRSVMKKHGLSYYPVIALGLLSVADTFQSYAFTVLTPEISRTLGISVGAIAAACALQGLAGAAAPP